MPRSSTTKRNADEIDDSDYTWEDYSPAASRRRISKNADTEAAANGGSGTSDAHVVLRRSRRVAASPLVLLKASMDYGLWYRIIDLEEAKSVLAYGRKTKDQFLRFAWYLWRTGKKQQMKEAIPSLPDNDQDFASWLLIPAKHDQFHGEYVVLNVHVIAWKFMPVIDQVVQFWYNLAEVHGDDLDLIQRVIDSFHEERLLIPANAQRANITSILAERSASVHALMLMNPTPVPES